MGRGRVATQAPRRGGDGAKPKSVSRVLASPIAGQNRAGLGSAAQASLSTRAVLDLQRSVGNGAVCQLLSGVAPRGGRGERPAVRALRHPRGSLSVQRFPASVAEAPIDWHKHPSDISRPGEGASGGIYFLQAKDPQAKVRRVVVKPVFPETAMLTPDSGEQLQFGDRFLSEILGASTPKSRVVAKGSGEFGQLLTLLESHHATGRTEPGQPLTGAKSLLVMSEVPNARSVSSLAEKATRGGRAEDDLSHIIFDPSLVGELARISVGDMLLGNADRIALGAMNVGNVMVSLQQGGPRVHAIDTSALLPKAEDPSEILSMGSGVSRGFSVKENLADPKAVIDSFYRGVVLMMQDHTPADQVGEPAWKRIEGTYDMLKEQIHATFEFDWHMALLDIHSLISQKEGRDKLRSLTGEYRGSGEESNLDYTTLKTRAMYLGARATGKSHEGAGTDSAAHLAYAQLSKRQPATLFEPQDRFSAQAAGTLTAGGASAAIGDLDVSEIKPKSLMSAITPSLRPYRQAELDKLGTVADQLRATYDQLGDKKRGPTRQTKTRNRSKAAAYLADTLLLAGGASRVQGLANDLHAVTESLAIMMGANLKAQQVGRVVPVAAAAAQARDDLATTADRYAAAGVATAAQVRRLRRLTGGAAFADSLEKGIDGATKSAKQRLDLVEQKNPRGIERTMRAYSTLRTRAR